MSAWITDRVPTREDGDCMTMVWVSSPREVYRCAYSVVKLGTPWQPITYPEPYVKPKVWTWEMAYAYGSPVAFISKDGKRTGAMWLDAGITKEDVDAMTDALNKLEETP